MWNNWSDAYERKPSRRRSKQRGSSCTVCLCCVTDASQIVHNDAMLATDCHACSWCFIYKHISSFFFVFTCCLFPLSFPFHTRARHRLPKVGIRLISSEGRCESFPLGLEGATGVTQTHMLLPYDQKCVISSLLSVGCAKFIFFLLLNGFEEGFFCSLDAADICEHHGLV